MYRRSKPDQNRFFLIQGFIEHTNLRALMPKILLATIHPLQLVLRDSLQAISVFLNYQWLNSPLVLLPQKPKPKATMTHIWIVLERPPDANA